jgi:UDP-N-acetylmuramate dehydrogenase
MRAVKKIEAMAASFAAAVGRPADVSAPLSALSWFRIGGPADLLFRAGTRSDVEKAAAWARREGVALYVVGGGSNMLFDDEGFRGLVIKDEAGGLVRRDETVTAQAGTPLADLVGFLTEGALGGLEFLAGIPGTVGGAVCGNAGAFGRSIGEGILSVELLLADGGTAVKTGPEMGFAYRRSILKDAPHIVLEARLRAEPDDPAAVRRRVDDCLKSRSGKHPCPGTACAGSYFKNPVLADGTKLAAGRLLERAGAKSLRVGDAAVFEGHANFIINAGRATAKDVRTLAAELKERVRASFGVELEEEVVYLPAAPAAP